jgi:hypothetical protein
MSWAIVLENHTDLDGVLLLSDDRGEAVSIAREVLRRGQRVVVQEYQIRPPALRPIPGMTEALSPDR